MVKETPEAHKAEEKVDLGQFKKPEDLLKSYKEIQGYTTKVAQENKALQEKLTAYEQQLQMIQMQQQYQPQQAPPHSRTSTRSLSITPNRLLITW